ncbi:hypothetical protein J4E08_00805 [Sagittula sp. NFXS13]|uniref:hypothetical protein n=1 Tax=Sagittula sp. NFXS13 TaxID=2819095 RepID=UPI0032DE62FB
MTLWRTLSLLWARSVAGLIGLTLLASCFPMDAEEELREELKQFVYLAQTRRFESQATCTAAIFDLAGTGVRSEAVRTVSNVRAGLKLVQEGRAVAFDVPGLTPNMVSEQMMSINLYAGMGLISSFVGPSLACMDDQFQVDAYYALMSQDTLTIYDPTMNAIMLLHRPRQLLFFMRGNV